MSRNPTCTWCRERLKRDEYRIENGGGTHEERFCTLAHVESFIEERLAKHVVVGIRGKVPVSRRARARYVVRVKFSHDLKLYDDRIRENGRSRK